MVTAEETQVSTPSCKRVIKFAPAIGDWTVLHPHKQHAKKIQRGLYHFDRLSESEVEEAHLLHYTVVDHVLRKWKNSLLIGTELYTISAEQQPYLDFLESIVSPVIQITVKSEKERICDMYMDLHLAQTLVSRALGFRDGTMGGSRSLSEHETVTLRTILESTSDIFHKVLQPWAGKPSFEVSGSPTFSPDNTIGGMNTYVVFEAEVAVGDSTAGKIGFGYVASGIRTLLEKHAQHRQTTPLRIWLPGSVLTQVSASVTVISGRTSISKSELENLEAGDVLILDQEIQSPLSVQVADKAILVATPGVHDGKISAKCFQKRTENLPAPELIREVPSSGEPEEAVETDEESSMESSLDEALTEEAMEEEEMEEEELEEEELEEEDVKTDGEEENPFKF